jgi:hypothetical protein
MDGNPCVIIPLFSLEIQKKVFSVTQPYSTSAVSSLDTSIVAALLNGTKAALTHMAVREGEAYANYVASMLVTCLTVEIINPAGPQGDLFGAPYSLLNVSFWLQASASADNHPDDSNSTVSLSALIDAPSTCAFISYQMHPSVAGIDASISSPAIVTTDIFPFTNIVVHFSAKPGSSERMTVICIPEQYEAYLTISPQQAEVTRWSYEQSAPIGSFTFQVSMKPIPNSLTADAAAVSTRITCTVDHSRGGLTNVYRTPVEMSIGATLLRAKWPLFSDVIVETKLGGLRSAWSSEVFTLPKACGDLCAENDTSIPTLWSLPVSDWPRYIYAVARPLRTGGIFLTVACGSNQYNTDCRPDKPS